MSNGSDRKRTMILSLNGEITAATVQSLREQLHELIEQKQANVIVNMAQVPFIDSAGLAAFVSGLKAAASAQTSLLLASMQPEVWDIFELTRLDRVFTIYKSQQEALEVLQSG